MAAVHAFLAAAITNKSWREAGKWPSWTIWCGDFLHILLIWTVLDFSFFQNQNHALMQFQTDAFIENWFMTRKERRGLYHHHSRVNEDAFTCQSCVDQAFNPWSHHHHHHQHFPGLFIFYKHDRINPKDTTRKKWKHIQTHFLVLPKIYKKKKINQKHFKRYMYFLKNFPVHPQTETGPSQIFTNFCLH